MAGTFDLAHGLTLPNSTVDPSGGGIVFETTAATHAFSFGRLGRQHGHGGRGNPGAAELQCGMHSMATDAGYPGFLPEEMARFGSPISEAR